MKILFIFTGGTIGSTLNGDYISTEKSKSYNIISSYDKKFGIDFDFDTVEPYTELSENNTGLNIQVLVDCVTENLKKDYDGIIVTHGTDTLQFSASAIAYATGNTSIPICLVSSNFPIENELSNGLHNLHAALLIIKSKLGKGVFVPYRNNDSTEILVHRATRLLSGKAFSDNIESAFNMYYGKFDNDFNYTKNTLYTESQDQIAPLSIKNINEKSGELLWLFPYPGMVYPELNDKVKYVLLNTYHSGTINTKSSSAIRFFENAKSKGVKLFITGITDGPSYDSTKLFDEFCITPIKNIAPVSAYVKLWILTTNGYNETELIHKSIAGDFVSL